MKTIKTFLILAFVSLPALASAQPGYYGPPAGEPGFHQRAGRLMFGISAGLGFMNDNGQSVDCAGCNYNPLAGEIDVHIGGMLNNRLAIMFEAQGNIQTIASDQLGDTTLTQSAFMGALQYWLTPQLWIKGGLGAAHLTVDDTYYGTSQPAGSGLAIMGAVGFELLSGRFFALDLQGRLIDGQYGSDRITGGTIGLGLNWF